jgi:hypothetical protein
MRPVRWIALLVTVVLTAWFAPAAGAAAPTAGERAARAEHQRIVDFWTPARVAKAVPRDFVLDPATGKVVAHAKPTQPSGTSTTGVTGASWTGGGAVLATTGKVLFSIGTSYYVCSASVVKDDKADRSLVLTAAHCVYEQKTRKFASNWLFVPEYDTNAVALTTDGSFCKETRHGCWTASAIAIRGEFASAGSFNTTAIQHDFAIVAVGSGGKSMSNLDDLGSHPIEYSTVSTGKETFLFGYPAARPYNGRDLVYSRGPLGTDPLTGGATYRVTSNMTGGSSGGPWFSPFSGGSGTLMSVNSYGYKGITAMHGPKLNDDTKSLFTAADAATMTQPGTTLIIGG